MPHKSFITELPDTPHEPLTFDVGGTRLDNGEPWKETFTCLRVAPAGVLDDLSSSSLLDPQGQRVYNATSLMAFFEGVVITEDEVRFRRLVHDKNRVVSIEQMGDVMMWLAEELTGRPTQR